MVKRGMLWFDDEVDLRLALNGPKYWSALFGFGERLRRIQKDGGDIEAAWEAWVSETKDIDWEEIP